MFLQARDRFENVRGQSKANDTLIVGVQLARCGAGQQCDQHHENVTICNGSSYRSSDVWSDTDHSHGWTKCESKWDHQETNVTWEWQRNCKSPCSSGDCPRHGCYSVSFRCEYSRLTVSEVANRATTNRLCLLSPLFADPIERPILSHTGSVLRLGTLPLITRTFLLFLSAAKHFPRMRRQSHYHGRLLSPHRWRMTQSFTLRSGLEYLLPIAQGTANATNGPNRVPRPVAAPTIDQHLLTTQKKSQGSLPNQRRLVVPLPCSPI